MSAPQDEAVNGSEDATLDAWLAEGDERHEDAPTDAPGNSGSIGDEELFYGITRQRLRSWTLWGAGLLCVSPLVPYEVIGEQPQFLWQLFAELPPSAVVAALAPALAGVVMLLGRWRVQRTGSLALLVLAALSAVFIVRKLGAEAAAWTLLPLPSSFIGRTTSGLLALALAAAGAGLAARPQTRRGARYLLWGAVAAALLFYAWPDGGEAPGMTILNRLAALPDMPTLGYKLGSLTLALVALWPALMAGLGLTQLRWPSRAPVSPVSMLALFGFPLIMLLLLLMLYLRSNPGGALFGALGAAADIVAVLILLAAALSALTHVALDPDADLLEPAGWPLKRALSTAAASVLLVTAAQWWLSRPPDKGVSWQLVAGSEAGDELYGEHVVAWSNARWSWDRQVRRDSSASALIRVKGRGRDMLQSAERYDPVVAKQLQALVDAGARLDTSARRWFRLVGDVNTASRARGLPYYLDPRVSIAKTDEGLRRHLLIDSYRVSAASTFLVDGDRYAMLQVRSFGKRRGAHNFGLLGFSRDQQPFALVVLDSNDNHLKKLRQRAAEQPPRCEVSFDPPRDAAMLRCGEALKGWLADAGEAERALIGLVERHELQHQIDGPLLTLAGSVLKKLAGYTDEAKKRVNRELSAYLAELTAAEVDPHLALVVPFQFAIMRDRGTYHHAAILSFEALVDRRLRDGRGRPDHEALQAAFDELASLSDEALRSRARDAWSNTFGGSLPSIERVSTSAAPASP